MSFDPCKFLENPTTEYLSLAKKNDLILLARELKIVEINSSMKKHDIKHIIVKKLVEMELMDLECDSVLEETSKCSDPQVDNRLKLEYLKLEIELIREKVKLAEKISSHRPKKFDVVKNLRLVPQFNEDDVDGYFINFEKLAVAMNWAKESWSILLQSVLTGRAREIYTRLSLEQSLNYDLVKEFILNGYELVPMANQQKFRQLRKINTETFIEFARKKEQLFDRWCRSSQVNSFEGLKNLILLEDFKNNIPHNVQIYLEEKRVSNLEEASRLAEEYSLIHRLPVSGNWGESGQNNNKIYGNVGNRGSISDSKSDLGSHSDSKYSKSICFYCRKRGHLIAQCKILKKKNSRINYEKPSGMVTLKAGDSRVAANIFEPFISNGDVALCGGEPLKVPINILRDTGASQSLLSENTLSFSKDSYTGRDIAIQGVGGQTTSLPLHNVNLNSELITGQVVVGVIADLPLPGINLVLGNDLAGGKVHSRSTSINAATSQNIKYNENKDVDIIPTRGVNRAIENKYNLDNLGEPLCCDRVIIKANNHSINPFRRRKKKLKIMGTKIAHLSKQQSYAKRLMSLQ